MAGTKTFDFGIVNSLVTEYFFKFSSNLLYVSAALGCHRGLHVVTIGAVVIGVLRRDFVGVVRVAVVGLTLKIGNFLVGNT